MKLFCADYISSARQSFFAKTGGPVDYGTFRAQCEITLRDFSDNLRNLNP